MAKKSSKRFSGNQRGGKSSRPPMKLQTQKSVVSKKKIEEPSVQVFRWEEDSSFSKIPFSTSLSVLTVGDGDFSFSYSLATLGINIVATAYDSKDEFFEKYENSFYQELLEMKVPIYFGIDVTKPKWSDRIMEPWNIIVWNFPHNGKGICSQDHNIYSQQQLLSKFLSSFPKQPSNQKFNLFSPILKKKHTISSLFETVHNNTLMDTFPQSVLVYLTIWSGQPYDSWNIRQIAKQCGLICACSFKFEPNAYPHYNHVKTKGGNNSGFNKPSKTFVFYN
jgi:25S rRNA (uracil2634-N3)-methyltransferase